MSDTYCQKRIHDWLDEDVECQYCVVDHLRTRVAELEKENKELRKPDKVLINSLAGAELELLRTREVVEKARGLKDYPLYMADLPVGLEYVIIELREALAKLDKPCPKCGGEGEYPKYTNCPLCEETLTSPRWGGRWWIYSCPKCEHEWADDEKDPQIECDCQGGEK